MSNLILKSPWLTFLNWCQAWIINWSKARKNNSSQWASQRIWSKYYGTRRWSDIFPQMVDAPSPIPVRDAACLQQPKNPVHLQPPENSAHLQPPENPTYLQPPENPTHLQWPENPATCSHLRSHCTHSHQRTHPPTTSQNPAHPEKPQQWIANQMTFKWTGKRHSISNQRSQLALKATKQSPSK